MTGATTGRQALPNRRPHFVGPLVEWAGTRWLVGVGLDPAGRAVEVFGDLADVGVEVEPAIITLVHEASITCSHLLQCGIEAEEQAARLAPSPTGTPGLLYLMLERAAATQREQGQLVRDIHAWLAEQRAAASAAAVREEVPI